MYFLQTTADYSSMTLLSLFKRISSVRENRYFSTGLNSKQFPYLVTVSNMELHSVSYMILKSRFPKLSTFSEKVWWLLTNYDFKMTENLHLITISDLAEVAADIISSENVNPI